MSFCIYGQSYRIQPLFDLNHTIDDVFLLQTLKMPLLLTNKNPRNLPKAFQIVDSSYLFLYKGECLFKLYKYSYRNDTLLKIEINSKSLTNNYSITTDSSFETVELVYDSEGRIIQLLEKKRSWTSSLFHGSPQSPHFKINLFNVEYDEGIIQFIRSRGSKLPLSNMDTFVYYLSKDSCGNLKSFVSYVDSAGGNIKINNRKKNKYISRIGFDGTGGIPRKYGVVKYKKLFFLSLGNNNTETCIDTGYTSFIIKKLNNRMYKLNYTSMRVGNQDVFFFLNKARQLEKIEIYDNMRNNMAEEHRISYVWKMK